MGFCLFLLFFFQEYSFLLDIFFIYIFFLFSFLWIFSLFPFQMLSPFPASLPSRNTLAHPPSPCFYECVPPPTHFHLPHPWFPYIGPRTTAKHTPVKSAQQAERPGSTHKAGSVKGVPGQLTSAFSLVTPEQERAWIRISKQGSPQWFLFPPQGHTSTSPLFQNLEALLI